MPATKRRIAYSEVCGKDKHKKLQKVSKTSREDEGKQKEARILGNLVEKIVEKFIGISDRAYLIAATIANIVLFIAVVSLIEVAIEAPSIISIIGAGGAIIGWILVLSLCSSAFKLKK